MASLLFDRLAKSRDKHGLLRLAKRGHEVGRPIDALNDPVVLEFLNLPESHRLVETQLEQGLIDNLQHFLMELGKGFAFVALDWPRYLANQVGDRSQILPCERRSLKRLLPAPPAMGSGGRESARQDAH